MALWITALSLSLSLAVFVIGLPVMLFSAGAFRWLADLDRRNAALVLGRPLRGHYRDHGGDAFLARLSATLRDPPDLAGPPVAGRALVVGLAFGCVGALADRPGARDGDAAALVLGAPRTASTGGASSGLWEIDTLWEALLVAPLAIPLAAITIVLLRVMARGEAGSRAACSGGRRGRARGPTAAPRRRRASRAAGCRCTSRWRRSPGSRAR